MNRLFVYLILGLTAAFFATVVTADAQTIRVKCEKRSDRSKASVDGNNLDVGGNFMFMGQIMSGSNTATSPVQAAVGDEAEFDFDSDPDDVAEGATDIAPNFIQNDQVTGKILDATGATVIMDTVNCRVKD